MSAAQARTVGTPLFGAYNMANQLPRQEIFHVVRSCFHESSEKNSRTSCGVSRKELHFFVVRRILGEQSGQEDWGKGGPKAVFIW